MWSASYGLMQLMPTTARMVGWKGTDPAELKIPPVNLTFGCKYIKSLIDYARGDVERALAIYNGGDKGNADRPFRNAGYAAKVFRWRERNSLTTERDMTIQEALQRAVDQGAFRKAADGDDKAASYFVRYAAYLANPSGDQSSWGWLRKTAGGKNIDGYAEVALASHSRLIRPELSVLRRSCARIRRA